MGNIDIIVDEELKERAIEKCNKIIDLLSDMNVQEKTFVLHQLIQSFKDITTIDVCKFIEYTEGGEKTKSEVSIELAKITEEICRCGHYRIVHPSGDDCLEEGCLCLKFTLDKGERRNDL